MRKSKPVYKSEKEIPYYEQTQKRTFSEKIRKIKNTFLMLLAYGCPSVKLRILMQRLRGVNIGKGCYLGMFCFIDNLYPEYVYIEDEASVNAGTMLVTHFNPLIRFKGVLPAKVSPIVIKKGAIIAVRCVVLPGVIIGENAVVSAGSVVSEDVEECTLVRGNPARRIGKIKL